MATHSSTLAWRIPWTEEPGRPQSMGSQRVQTQLSDFTSLTSLSRRALRRTLLSDDLGLWKLHGRLTRFLRIYQQKHYQPGIKGTETAWNEERMTLRTEPKYRSLWWWDLLEPRSWGSHPIMPRGQSIRPQRIIPRLWNLMKLSLLVFKTCLGPIISFSIPISPVWKEHVYSMPG